MIFSYDFFIKNQMKAFSWSWSLSSIFKMAGKSLIDAIAFSFLQMLPLAVVFQYLRYSPHKSVFWFKFVSVYLAFVLFCHGHQLVHLCFIYELPFGFRARKSPFNRLFFLSCYFFFHFSLSRPSRMLQCRFHHFEHPNLSHLIAHSLPQHYSLSVYNYYN